MMKSFVLLFLSFFLIVARPCFATPASPQGCRIITSGANQTQEEIQRAFDEAMANLKKFVANHILSKTDQRLPFSSTNLLSRHPLGRLEVKTALHISERIDNEAETTIQFLKDWMTVEHSSPEMERRMRNLKSVYARENSPYKFDLLEILVAYREGLEDQPLNGSKSDSIKNRLHRAVEVLLILDFMQQVKEHGFPLPGMDMPDAISDYLREMIALNYSTHEAYWVLRYAAGLSSELDKAP